MRKILISGSQVLMIVSLAVGVAFAQHDHSAMQSSKSATAPKPSAAANAPAATTKKPGDPDEIFCPTMKTGQLCSHGTSDALSLEDAKREVWIEAVRRYNKTVDDATVQIMKDAKDLLDPAKSAEVARWFEKGVMNPKINVLLDTDKKKTSK